MFKFLKDIEELKNPFIGEVYTVRFDNISSYYEALINISKQKIFHKFRKTDVQDVVDNNIKIFCSWHDKKDVIFYDATYNKQREAIKKRNFNERSN